MLSLNEIAANTIKHTRDLVGDLLSDLPVASGSPSLKAVIDIRQKGPIPTLPYIVVDIEGYKDQSGWLLNHGAVEATHPETNEVNYYPYYDRNVEFMILYYCYGEESQDILRELKGRFNFDSVRERIYEDSDVRLIRSGPIVRTPDLESTDYRDAANMSVRYAAVDRYIDFGGGIIRRVTYDSTLVEKDNNRQEFPDTDTININ